MKLLRGIFICLILFLQVGCSLKATHRQDFDPTSSLRVATLPFYQRDKAGNFINPEEDIFLTENAGIAEKGDQSPAATLRNMVTQELAQTNLDLIPFWKSRADLVHHDYTAGQTYDYRKILSASPQKLCEIMGCEALLYGEVIEWDSSYYIAQSVNSVAFKLMLVDAKTGKTLFETNVEDASSAGITGGPTGYTSLILEPLKGLRESGLYNVANEAVEAAIAPLIARNRPEFLKSPPPSIFATAHNAPDGYFEKEKGLTVLAVASAGKQSYFSVGSRIKNIPMIETIDGHYRGTFYPLPGESFEKQVVSVIVRDQFGREARQKVGLSYVTLKK